MHPGIPGGGYDRSLKMDPVRTSFESPWQIGVAERWVAKAVGETCWITSFR